MISLAEPPARSLRSSDWWTNEDHLFAVDLYNAAFYWEAHVYWERLWALPATEPLARSLLRGLIQLTAAALKKREEQEGGERKLLEKSRASFDALPPARFVVGVDVESIGESLGRGELPARLELRLEKP